MSNVPEVVMCYHLDGIVQKYELIKTEDLPHHTDPKFSPELIRDVAQNILSFLKSNATKAGHTYWLFKGSVLIFIWLLFINFLFLFKGAVCSQHSSTQEIIAEIFVGRVEERSLNGR